MYSEYYNLGTEPFDEAEKDPPLFQHESFALARVVMQRALLQGNGMLMVLGPRGSGKSILARTFVRELRAANTHVAVMTAGSTGANDLLVNLCRDFGQRAIAQDKAALLQGLEGFLLNVPQAALVIDDAENLTKPDFQDLRLLSYLRHPSRTLLQVYLLGTQDLYDHVRSSEPAMLHQGEFPVYSLSSLNLQETRDYIAHHLRCSGWRGNPEISSDSFKLIHQLTQGLPASINDLCTQLLQYGEVNRRNRLNVEDIKKVTQNSSGESLSAVQRAAVVNDHRAETEGTSSDLEADRTNYVVDAARMGERAPANSYPKLKLVADEGTHSAVSEPVGGEREDRRDQERKDEVEQTEPVDPAATHTAPVADESVESTEHQRPAPAASNQGKKRTRYFLGGVIAVFALLAGTYQFLPRITETVAGVYNRIESILAPDELDVVASGKQDLAPDSRDDDTGTQRVLVPEENPARERSPGPQQADDGSSLPGHEPAAARESGEEPLGDTGDITARSVVSDTYGDTTRADLGTDAPVAGDSAPTLLASAELARRYASETIHPARAEVLNDRYVNLKTRREIDRLVSLAEQAFAMDRLRTPPEGSAWYYYQQVLKHDPESEEVKAGIRKIAKRYGKLAYGEIDKESYELALMYLHRGLELVPDDSELLSLRRKILEQQGRY